MAAAIALWGCQTPGVETAAPDYSTTDYVYDLGVCNAADLVRNTALGAVEVVKGMAVGFVVGAGLESRSRNTEPVLVLTAGAVGSVVGVGVGLYRAVDRIDLTVDDCLAREGFTLAGGATPETL